VVFTLTVAGRLSGVCGGVDASSCKGRMVRNGKHKLLELGRYMCIGLSHHGIILSLLSCQLVKSGYQLVKTKGSNGGVMDGVGRVVVRG